VGEDEAKRAAGDYVDEDEDEDENEGEKKKKKKKKGYQSVGWSVGPSSTEVTVDAVRVTAARDEPWRHLAHDGRQERVPVTSLAPPGHHPSQPGRWCTRLKGSFIRTTNMSVYPASLSARLMTTGRSRSRAAAGGGAGAREGGVLRADGYRLLTGRVTTLCIIT
jgi:hypothetical protein